MLRRSQRVVYLTIIILLLVANLQIFFREESFIKKFIREKIELNEIEVLVDNPLHLINADFYNKVDDYELKDWHDYEFIAYEASRVGPGENGSAVELTDPNEIKTNQRLFEIEGLHVVVSDKISVNRSLPDVRHDKCRSKLYLKHLPRASIIVIFHNEHPSLIKRTLHSIFNRTPADLLGEIILVNDASTKDELGEAFEVYVGEQFKGKVKILKLKKRVGLIVAKMEGAWIATQEVLVFLDSHVEVNVNWLPPLLEPIALNPRACTTPIIDQYNWKTWQYEVFDVHGVRGIFTWNFEFRSTSQEKLRPTHPKPTPVMLGCAFAINRRYFWDLGGYDEQLLIWSGENYELSFKLWLCGGELLECPCSRIAHVFRQHNEYRQLDEVDFVARNFKRIAEVWMGDWKEILYKSDTERFRMVDAGDLTKQKAIRDELNCKPFDYFINQIAPEIPEIFPIPRDDDIAYGTLQTSFNGTNYCVTDFGGKGKFCSIGTLCAMPKNLPHKSQFFHLSSERRVEHDRTATCFSDLVAGANDRWNYNLETRQIILNNSTKCLAADTFDNNLIIDECNSFDSTQRWTFGFVNETLF